MKIESSADDLGGSWDRISSYLHGLARRSLDDITNESAWRISRIVISIGTSIDVYRVAIRAITLDDMNRLAPLFESFQRKCLPLKEAVEQNVFEKLPESDLVLIARELEDATDELLADAAVPASIRSALLRKASQE